MRYVKSLVGYLCLISFIGALIAGGFWVYFMGVPFFKGAVMYYTYGGISVQDVVNNIAGNGVDASDAAALENLSEETSMYNIETGAAAVAHWIIDRLTERKIQEVDVYGTPKPRAFAAVVVDPTGRLVAAYPLDLMLNDVLPPLDRSSRKSQLEWGRNFAVTANAYGPVATDPEFVIMKDPHGSEIGTLVLLRYGKLQQWMAVYPRGTKSPEKDISVSTMWATWWLVCYLILLPIWVGMDAAWRGMRPFSWAFLIVLTNWIGLLAYDLFRLAPPRKCPNCGEQVYAKYKRCPACGVTLNTTCPTCGRRLKPGWEYCPSCYKKQVDQPVQESVQTEPVAEPEPQVDLTALPARSRAAMSVQVVDATSGAPIPQAHVALHGAIQRAGATNASGVFEAMNLLPGSYRVEGSMHGYEDATLSVDVGENARETVEIRLNPWLASVSGRVTELGSGRALAQATVFIDSSRVDVSSVTDDAGEFKLSSLPPGPYTLVAEAEGFMGQTKLVDLSPGQQMRTDFVLASVEDSGERHGS